MRSGAGTIAGLLAVVILAFLGGLGVMSLRQRTTATPIEIIPPPTDVPPATVAPTPEPTTGPLRVYVSGAVLNPAVYTLPPGSIIDDAVRAAGGFAADADPVAVNLAQALVDGMQIYIPTLAEAVEAPPAISVPQPTAAPGANRMGGITIGGLININLATQADLEMLPGIGPTTAEKIIAYREANGPFATIEAIMDVPGIGEGKFDAIKELITVGP